MRGAILGVLFVVVCLVSGAAGRDQPGASGLDQFARDVQDRIIPRPGVSVAVAIRDCRMHIEYGAAQAAFDLPLPGTLVSTTDAADGIMLHNRSMTRTIQGRGPEAFEDMLLRFDRHDIPSLMKAFAGAISACGGQGQPTVVAVH